MIDSNRSDISGEEEKALPPELRRPIFVIRKMTTKWEMGNGKWEMDRERERSQMRIYAAPTLESVINKDLVKTTRRCTHVYGGDCSLYVDSFYIRKPQIWASLKAQSVP